MQFSVYLFTKNMSLQQQVIELTNFSIIEAVKNVSTKCECGEELIAITEERDGGYRETLWVCPKCD